MKRIIALILLSVLSWALLFTPISSLAAPKNSDSIDLDVFTKDVWTAHSGISRISKRSVQASPMLSFSSEKDAEKLVFSAELQELDLSPYNEIALEMSARGTGEEYPVSVALSGGGATESADFTLIATGDTLYVPLPESIRSSLTSISITVTAGDEPISYITLTKASADAYFTYSYRELFASSKVSTQYKAEFFENEIRVKAEDAKASISPSFIEAYTKSNTVLAWVKLSGAISGSIVCTAEYETVKEDGRESEIATTVSAPQTVTADGTYVFPVTGGFSSLSFDLSALPAEAHTVTFTEAGIILLGKNEQSAGSISSCRYDGKKIVVSGSISSAASVKYNGSKLLLYAINASEVQDFNVSDHTPAETVSFSTKFRISLTSDAYYAQRFYRVYLDTPDGKIPVGDLTAADGATSAPPATSSVSALHASDAADVFETNTSHVILDVFAGQLLTGDHIHSALAYNYGTTYYFDRDVLSELDRAVSFYNSCGVGVYLRVYSDREGYLFDYSADSDSSVSIMCAVATFLSERYPTLGGFIMGPAVNEKSYVAEPETAECLARLCAMFTECAKSKNPALAVFIPFSADGAEPYLSAALLQYFLAKYSAPNSALLYETTTPKTTDASFAHVISQISSMFTNASDGAALMWTCPAGAANETVIQSYKSYCKDALALGLRFCALSLTDNPKQSPLYDGLKSMMDTENVIPSTITQLTATVGAGEYKGRYDLWDFTDSYDASDWVAGGSFSTPESAKGDAGGRILRSFCTDDSTAAGILIGKLDTKTDMNGLSALLELCVKSEDRETADVSIIFGGGNARAEFSATVECNAPVSLFCDMSAYSQSSATDYCAIIVRGAKSPEIQVSRISLCSNEQSDEELQKVFLTTAEKETNPLLYASVITLCALTVTVFSILFRKKKATASKGKRND